MIENIYYCKLLRLVYTCTMRRRKCKIVLGERLEYFLERWLKVHDKEDDFILNFHFDSVLIF